MLEEAYAYGLTPKEATELTVAEMASFILAKRKKELELTKILAQIGYSAGVVGSSAFAKRRPRFEDMFNFPKEQSNTVNDVDSFKSQMLVWAMNANRLARKSSKKEK